MTELERQSWSTCSVCAKPELEEIERLIVNGTGYRTIAARYGVSISALSRHRKNHLSPVLQAVHAKREERHGERLLERVERLVSKVEALADDAAAAGKASQLLAAAKELRESYKLIGSLTGELDQRPVTLNVLVSPEWQQVRSALLQALSDFPEARVAVAGRLLELEGAAPAARPALPPAIQGTGSRALGDGTEVVG